MKNKGYMKFTLRLKIALLFLGVMLLSALASLTILAMVFGPVMTENSETQVKGAANSIRLMSRLNIGDDSIKDLLSIPPIYIEEISADDETIQRIRYQIDYAESRGSFYIESSGIFPTSTLYMTDGDKYISVSALSKDNNYWVIYFIIILSFIICVVIGTLITIFLTRMLLKPIDELNRASSEVARGNFSVRVPEKGLSEYRSLQRNFNRMAEELSGTETLRGDFISNVSHEFKTPLASIQGFAKLLQDDSISENDRKEYTQVIIDETVRLSKLTSNILNLSKLENQTTIPNKVRFSLDEQIRKIILMLEPEWSKKNIDMDIALDDISYYGNEELMGQIWQNIINNAIKFTPVDGKISVHLYQTESNIMVKISDNGIGISHEAKEKIFEKFYQGDHSRKTEGNGLGLALVKRIIDLCSGKVYVENLFEGGVCFTVELPFVIGDMMQ